MGSVRGVHGISHINLDDAIGLQRNSLRPTSSRYSFPKSARLAEEKSCQDTPGPGIYNYPSALSSVSVVMGTARSRRSESTPYRDQDQECGDDLETIPDSSRYRFGAPPRPTFGCSERGGKVMDTEFIRACGADHEGYGANGPGFIYSPDDKYTRPRSAPAYTLRGRQADKAPKRCSTPTKVAPNSYPGARQDAIGVQHSSRRRTARASSFGRAERFPAPKPAAGDVSEDCMGVRSSFGSRCAGSRRTCSHGTFGRATREGTARATATRSDGDKAIHANLSRQRLPHPPLAPRQEILRYGDNHQKPN